MKTKACIATLGIILGYLASASLTRAQTTGIAPSSIVGDTISLTQTSPNAVSYTVTFGDTAYNGVGPLGAFLGTYTWIKTDDNNGQMTALQTYPANNAGDVSTVYFTFVGTNSGSFSNVIAEVGGSISVKLGIFAFVAPMLTGHVYCSCDGSPVTNASVQIGTNYFTTTDSSGSYGITNIPVGTFAATVTAANYDSLTNSMIIPSPALVATNDFYLTNKTLVIHPTYDTTITTDAHAAAITNAIKPAIEVYKYTIANPLCLRILFVGTNDPNHGGASTVAYNTIPYPQYRAHLQGNTNKSANDLTAVATLTPNSGTGTNNNSQTVYLTAANLLAIGEFGLADDAVVLHSFGGYHGIIKLDVFDDQYLSIKLARLQGVAAHEINEVLGIGGWGSQVSFQDDTIGPLDLFRYRSTGKRCFTTDPNAVAYFSIDGGKTTNVFFNQYGHDSDYGDWGDGKIPADGLGNNPPKVQDARRTDNLLTSPPMGMNEFIALDVVGYTLLTSPPIIQTPALAANSFSFSWPTLPGLLYQAQATTNLTGNVWTDLGGPITASDMSAAISDTNVTALKQFYRIIALPPPTGP